MGSLEMIPTAIEHHAATLVQQAEILQVATTADLEQATALRARLKAVLQAAKEFFDPVSKKLDAAKAEFLAGRRQVEGPLLAALAGLNDRIAAYLDAEATIRKREEMALAEAARAQAEAAQVERAAALERLGQPEAAEHVLAQPVSLAPVTLPKPAAAGLTTRTDWRFEIVDVALLPRAYLLPDMVKIGGVVRATKGLTAIPGIRVYPKTVPFSRRV